MLLVVNCCTAAVVVVDATGSLIQHSYPVALLVLVIMVLS